MKSEITVVFKPRPVSLSESQHVYRFPLWCYSTSAVNMRMHSIDPSKILPKEQLCVYKKINGSSLVNISLHCVFRLELDGLVVLVVGIFQVAGETKWDVNILVYLKCFRTTTFTLLHALGSCYWSDFDAFAVDGSCRILVLCMPVCEHCIPAIS